MKIRKISFIIFIIFVSCSKNREQSLLSNIKLPRSSILGFSNKIGIVIKDYALLRSELYKEKDNNTNEYSHIIKKGTILKIEKTMEEDEEFGLKGKWIQVTYKKNKKYIFSKDINIIDNVIIE